MKLSVVVPVRNEEASIRVLLDSLLTQTVHPDEILVADNGSTDSTPEIVSEYAQRNGVVRLISGGPGFPGRGRNLGAAHARNEWIAFIDAGTRPVATWLESLATRAQLEGGVDVVYGSFEPISDTVFKQCSVMAYVSPPVEIEGRLVRTRSVASLLLKRKVWDVVGGFPEDLRSAEDLLFLNAIEQKNFRSTTAPDALVHWQVQATPWGTFKRFVTYASNNMRAGLWRQWQAAIFKRYGLLIASAAPAFWLGARWLLVTALLWLLMLAARAAVVLWRNRACYPAGIMMNAARMMVLMPILGMLDAATIIGTVQWAITAKSPRAPSKLC